MPKRATHQEYQAELRRIYGPEQIVLDPYVNRTTRLRHKCTNCGDVRLKTPWRVLAGSRGNLVCCRQAPTTESYIAELEAVGSVMRPIAPYLGRLKKSWHRCTVCSYEAESLPKHLLNGHGCFACAKDKQRYGSFERKIVKIAGRRYSLQGFEPQALQYMIDRGANPKNIAADVSQGKPTFKYKFEGKIRTYIPDFYHTTKNRVIEVKSVWTFGLSPSQGSGPFKKNAAKARAAIAAGYNFLLILMDREGNRLQLPEGWYNMKLKDVQLALS